MLAVCLAILAGAGADRALGADANETALLYKQGVSALEEGNAALARESFAEVLRRNPRHTRARIQLDRMRGRGGELAALKRKNQLKKIKIPKVDYDEVSLPEALEALGIEISNATEGKFIPNFIVQDPGKHLERRPVSLRLNNVPASVVLKHLLSLADAKERYDEYAIIIRPLNTRSSQPVTPTTGLEGAQ